MFKTKRHELVLDVIRAAELWAGISISADTAPDSDVLSARDQLRQASEKLLGGIGDLPQWLIEAEVKLAVHGWLTSTDAYSLAEARNRIEGVSRWFIEKYESGLGRPKDLAPSIAEMFIGGPPGAAVVAQRLMGAPGRGTKDDLLVVERNDGAIRMTRATSRGAVSVVSVDLGPDGFVQLMRAFRAEPGNDRADTFHRLACDSFEEVLALLDLADVVERALALENSSRQNFPSYHSLKRKLGAIDPALLRGIRPTEPLALYARASEHEMLGPVPYDAARKWYHVAERELSDQH